MGGEGKGHRRGQADRTRDIEGCVRQGEKRRAALVKAAGQMNT